MTEGDAERGPDTGTHPAAADPPGRSPVGPDAGAPRPEPRPADELPSALDPAAGVPALLAGRGGRRALAAFLDFDGTLSPIVAGPERARLARSTREAVRRLARQAMVAVLSGRDLRDVRRRVGLPGVWYAGSHGLEIAGPAGRGLAVTRGRERLPELDGAEAALRDALAAVPGAAVERKRFAIAVHLRRVAPADRERAEAAFERVAAGFPGLRATTGKEVRELLPGLRWDKGAAVEWLLAATRGAGPGAAPVVIGDDVTDEDAFRVARETGAAVVVGAGGRTTLATHALADMAEVEGLLRELALVAARGRRGGAPLLPSRRAAGGPHGRQERPR